MKQQAAYTSFVNLFPEIKYDSTDDGSGARSLDIWNAYRVFVTPFQNYNDAFFDYEVKVEDTLYGIANKFYGDAKLWWVIVLVNNAEDPFDFLDNVRDGDEGTKKTIKMLKETGLTDFLISLRRLKATENINIPTE